LREPDADAAAGRSGTGMACAATALPILILLMEQPAGCSAASCGHSPSAIAGTPRWYGRPLFVNVLLDNGLISSETFTALLLMAVASTMLTVPMVAGRPRRARELIFRAA
jgi:hypothetical protein